MRGKIETFGDLANFLERLLRGQIDDRWEIDDFESVAFTKKKEGRLAALECWRRSIIDVASIKRNVPDGHWMHPEAKPHLEKIMEVLRYLDENDQ